MNMNAEPAMRAREAAARARELGHDPEPWQYVAPGFAGTFCARCNALLYVGLTTEREATWGGRAVEERCPQEEERRR